MAKKPKTNKKGVVQKIIKQIDEPEKAEIRIDGADELYREVRIENKLERTTAEMLPRAAVSGQALGLLMDRCRAGTLNGTEALSFKPMRADTR
jgi:hypothetical protein